MENGINYLLSLFNESAWRLPIYNISTIDHNFVQETFTILIFVQTIVTGRYKSPQVPFE